MKGNKTFKGTEDKRDIHHMLYEPLKICFD